MNNYTLSISEDEALVLFQFVARSDETDDLTIPNAAEYAALAHLSAQIDQTTAAMFDPDYETLLLSARRRLSKKVAGTWPGKPSEN